MSDIRPYIHIDLGNVGDLAKPGTKLVEVASVALGGAASAVGAIFEPWQIGRISKAKSKARIREAETDIEISELRQRTEIRRISEDMSHQKNIEDIIQKAISELNDDANPEDMEIDWVANVLSKIRYISDEDMQKVWAKILAGEANEPGSFSRRTVNLLNDFGKRDAGLFEKLCKFVWKIEGKFVVTIFEYNDRIYTGNGLNFDAIMQLDNLGLLQYSTSYAANYYEDGLPECATAQYSRDSLSVRTSGGNLETGRVILTQAGRELAKIAKRTPVEGFLEYAKGKWRVGP